MKVEIKKFNPNTDLKKLENYLRNQYLENKNMTSWLPERLHDLIFRMDTQYTDAGDLKSSDYIFIWEDNSEIVGCILPDGDAIREWEENTKSLDAINLPRLAKVYEVSLNAIKIYDFINPIDEIYYQMWLEEQYPYYQFKIEPNKFASSAYNFNVQNGINEWLKMREKRENYEITDQEYIEWKLNFEIDD